MDALMKTNETDRPLIQDDLKEQIVTVVGIGLTISTMVFLVELLTDGITKIYSRWREKKLLEKMRILIEVQSYP